MTTVPSIELRRLLARRLVRLVAALAVLGIVIASIVVAAKSQREDPGQLRATAEARRALAVQRCKAGELSVPPQAIPPGETLDQFCEQQIALPFHDPRFHLTTLSDVFAGTTVPLVLMGWLLAASFIGADWHAGTMTTQLTWEPRRVRLLLVKVAVCITVAFLATVAFQALLGLGLSAAAALRGTTEGIDRAWLLRTLGVLLRGAALAGAAAAIGFSLASVARNTAAALGVGFGYLLILENLIGALRPGWRSWFLAPNAVVLVDGRVHPEIIPRTVIEAAVVIALYGVGTVLIATTLFARRDVT